MKKVDNYLSLALFVLMGMGLFTACEDEEPTPPAPEASFSVTPAQANLADTVRFTNTSKNAVSYSWSFGNGLTSTEESPHTQYNEAGTYEVVLIAKGPGGTTREMQTVTINESAPKAGFEVQEAGSLFAEEMVQFTNTTQPDVPGQTYLWNFGDAEDSSSEDKNPSFTYPEPGTYTVTLTATGEGGSTSYSQDVVIRIPLPIADFEVENEDALVAGQPVQLTNYSQWGESYLWEFGEGSTSAEENPVFTFTEAGTYTIMLTTINASGQSSLSREVDVKEPVTVPDSPAVFLADSEENQVHKFYLGEADPEKTTAFSVPDIGYSLALDKQNEQLYFINEADGGIYRSGLHGSGMELVVSTGGTPVALALDVENSKIYWTDKDRSTVSVANLDGSGLQDLVSTNPVTGEAGSLEGIFLDKDNNKIYWTDVVSAADEGVYRANLDGSQAEKVVAAWSHAVAVSGGKLYYSDVNNEAVMVAELDGSNQQALGQLAYRSYGIALDEANGYLYWTDLGDDLGDGRLNRILLDGSGSEERLAEGLADPRGLILNLE